MSEVKEHSVIYLSPSDDPEREWCQDDVWEESVRYNLGADFDRVTAERDALEAVLRELLSGTGTSPGANKKYGKARAVLEGLPNKEDGRICTPINPHNYHLGECTKCGAISPTE